jgi:hypothetical protein
VAAVNQLRVGIHAIRNCLQGEFGNLRNEFVN